MTTRRRWRPKQTSEDQPPRLERENAEVDGDDDAEEMEAKTDE